MEPFKKRLLISAIVLALPLATIAASKEASNTDEETVDAVAAIVNDSVITESEVSDKVSTIKRQLTMANKDIPSDNDMRKKILNAMINQKVQLELADRADIQVDQDELNNALERLAQQNHVTLEVMRNQIEAEGMSYADFRKEIKMQIRLQKLQQSAVGAKVTVSDKEVTEAINKMSAQGVANTEYHIANILISLPESPTTQQVQRAERRANSIIAKIKKGAKFSKVANSDSDGDQSLQGGDLGWRKLVEIPDIFTDKIKTMHEGDVVGPVRAPNGYHIIKLVGMRTDTKNMPNKNQIKAMLFNRKMNEKVGEWVQQMRDSAYVKILT